MIQITHDEINKHIMPAAFRAFKEIAHSVNANNDDFDAPFYDAFERVVDALYNNVPECKRLTVEARLSRPISSDKPMFVLSVYSDNVNLDVVVTKPSELVRVMSCQNMTPIKNLEWLCVVPSELELEIDMLGSMLGVRSAISDRRGPMML